MKTHTIPFSILKKKIILNHPKSASRYLSKGPKNEFERATSDRATEGLLYNIYVHASGADHN